MKATLTIFTPAYNRAYTLHKCYESLKKQINKDFEWLIIDDGSTDNTRELVQSWIEENLIPIKYHYQKNQGMHGAHNSAYELIDTKLNVCIDSDDYMPDDAVEKILKFWEENQSEEIAGIAALDAYESGEVIGTTFPKDLKTSTSFDMYYKYGVCGDKKFIYKTELTKKFPYPIFEGEKYVGLAYKYRKIDLTHKLALMNEVVCIVEYMEDGSSRNMLKQYINNPKGNLKYKFKECVHYVSSNFIIKNRKFIKESPLRLLTVLATPAGFCLYKYITKKNKID